MTKSIEIRHIVGAALYDCLLAIGIVIPATLLWMLFNEGQAVPAGHLGYRAYLLLLLFCYFGYCWTHSGQTVGAKAWRMKVLTKSNHTLNWWQAALRYLLAVFTVGCFGIGLLWKWIDKDKLTLYDRLTASKVIRCP